MRTTSVLTMSVLAIAVSACTGGGASGGNSTPANIVNSGKHTYQTKHQQPPLGAGVSPIGYNSILNSPAPVNCYNYSVNFGTGQFTSGTSYAEQANNFMANVGVTVSAKGSIDIVHLSATYKGSWAWGGSNVGGDAVAYGQYTVPVTFQVESLNQTGQTLLAQGYQPFVTQCGDQVLSGGTLQIVSDYELGFTSSDQTFNQSYSVNQKADIMGIASLSNSITAEEASGNSTINTNSTVTNYGYVDPTTFETAATNLAACIGTTSVPANPQTCQTGLQQLANSAQIGGDDAVAAISAGNQDWGYYFQAVPSTMQAQPAYQVLAEIGQPVVQADSPFVAYQTIITQNAYVLMDLITANYQLQNSVVPTLASMYKGNNQVVSAVAGGNLNNLLQYYSLNSVINSYETVINNCANALSPSAVAQNCSLLSTNPTIQSVIAQYYPAVVQDSYITQNFPTVMQNAILATIEAMIYNITITPTSEYNTVFETITSLPIAGSLVYLPVDQSNPSYRTMMVLAVPATTLTNLSTAYQIGVGQFSATTNNPSWFESVPLSLSWFNGNTLYQTGAYWTNVTSGWESGVVPNPTYAGDVGFTFNPSGSVNWGLPGGGDIAIGMANGASGGYTCTPNNFYQANSKVCTFNAGLEHANYIQGAANPDHLNISAYTNYVSGNSVYGQVFLTLYPWN